MREMTALSMKFFESSHAYGVGHGHSPIVLESCPTGIFSLSSIPVYFCVKYREYRYILKVIAQRLIL